MRPPSAARRDQWTAAGLGVVALGYLLAGRRYPLDTLATPGPGIFPLAAGLALLALAVWQFLTARRHAGSPTGTSLERPTRAPLIMSVVLGLYAAGLPVLGFVLASFALVFVAARLMGLEGWWRPGALALGVALASRVVFVTWLGVPLP
jgi:Tripartite tricarboxylate transporter TctB family